MNRIRSLDGLRAIAIIMVLLSHSIRTMPKVISKNFFYQFIANSDVGVRIFFVISGYLITRLLMTEKDRNGSVSIKKFYMRRIFRIFPVFYLYILVILILKFAFAPHIIKYYSDVIPAALYVWNYEHLFTKIVGNANLLFGHFWTLSMEEQFYFIWPFLFSIFYINSSKVTFTKFVAASIILMPCIRVATYFFMPNSRGQIGMMLQTGGDSILIGCLGALVENTRVFKQKLNSFLKNRFYVTFTLLFLFFFSPLLSKRFGGAYNITIGLSLMNVFILIFVFWCINTTTRFSKILNSKFLIQIGILSYSIYVWQQLFLNRINDIWINKFPQNLLVVFIVAFISYYAIEKPILKLSRKFKVLSKKENNETDVDKSQKGINGAGGVMLDAAV